MLIGETPRGPVAYQWLMTDQADTIPATMPDWTRR